MGDGDAGARADDHDGAPFDGAVEKTGADYQHDISPHQWKRADHEENWEYSDYEICNFFCQQNVSPGSSPASQFTPTVPIQPV